MKMSLKKTVKATVASLAFLLPSMALAGGGGVMQHHAYDCSFKGETEPHFRVIQNADYFMGSFAVDQTVDCEYCLLDDFYKFKGAYDEGDSEVFPFTLGGKTLKIYLPKGDVSGIEAAPATFDGIPLSCSGAGFIL